MSATTRTNTIAARGAAVIVAAVAGAASFEHIASVAIGAGERTWVGYSLPFAIDGLIVVGVAALLEDKRHRRHGRLSARLAVLVGVVATLAANIASAEPTWTARLVAITAPVSFLLSVEVLTRSGRRLSTPDDTGTGAPAATAPGKSAPAPRPRSTAKRQPSAAERVAKAVAKTPNASATQVAARLHVSERTVQRHWPRRTTLAAPRGPEVAPVPADAFERATGPARVDGSGASR